MIHNKIYKFIIIIFLFGYYYRFKYYSIKKINKHKFEFIAKNSNNIKNIDIKLNYYKNFIKDIPYYNHSHIYSNNIYWCWLQGKDNAPELYKATFNSVINNCINHNILIINQTNLYKYIKFPNFILEKYKKKIIDNTHFSDLLRLELLIKYGGTWIDASVLMTKYDETFFKKDLFFFKTINDTRISGSNWFITAEKDSPVLKTTRDLIYEYWRKENYLFDYFIFHLLFTFSYQKYINDYLQIPNFSNVPVHYLQKQLMNKFNITLYSNILKIASVHKLTKRFSSRNDSFINYIINRYKERKKNLHLFIQ